MRKSSANRPARGRKTSRTWLYTGLIAVIAAVFIYGCRSETTAAPASEGGAEMAIQLTSNAFTEGGTIPRRQTCDGEDISPPLSWSGIPPETQSLALIVDDPDAPRGDWVHWVLFDLPPDLGGLPEGISGKGTAGKNDFGRTGYGGPCPPRGSNHRYYFKLYALDQVLGLPSGATKQDVEAAMAGHILAQGQLMGRYSR